jgi:hypothetical protein
MRQPITRRFSMREDQGYSRYCAASRFGLTL